MSYFPIISAPDCEGWTELSNFPPNNWEARQPRTKFINLTWSADGVWTTTSLGTLEPSKCRLIAESFITETVPKGSLPLLSLTETPVVVKSNALPVLDSAQTSLPAWRATLGLATPAAKTSYQGELDAFPSQGSLLTFGPFLQFGAALKNYLIFVNIESSPVSRSASLEIYDAAALTLKGTFPVRNNSATSIPLDELGFRPGDLPLFICRGMAGIPLYFSSAMQGTYLSLEHTHPPASLVAHGQRWEAQKLLKKRWFEKTRPK